MVYRAQTAVHGETIRKFGSKMFWPRLSVRGKLQVQWGSSEADCCCPTFVSTKISDASQSSILTLQLMIHWFPVESGHV